MKKLILSFFTAFFLLGTASAYSDQMPDDQITMMKIGFGIDILECNQFGKSVNKVKQSVSSNTFMYQNTTDGWLQQCAVYSDFIVGTVLEGPRQGTQIIMWENLAMDMSHSYKQHKDYVSHKYSWGEIKTYKTYQTVIFN